MAEQLTFHKFARNRSAVDAEHGAIGSCARFVDGPCDELFADAAFASNEYTARRFGNTLNSLFELEHRGALAKQLVEVGVLYLQSSVIHSQGRFISSSNQRGSQKTCGSDCEVKRVLFEDLFFAIQMYHTDGFSFI